LTASERPALIHASSLPDDANAMYLIADARDRLRDDIAFIVQLRKSPESGFSFILKSAVGGCA
jgi:hypothetical protein